GGIAVEAFTSEIFSTGLRATLSIVLTVIGFVLASGAAFRWHRIESAMRRKTSLPLPLIIPIVSLAAAPGAGLLLLLIAGHPRSRLSDASPADRGRPGPGRCGPSRPGRSRTLIRRCSRSGPLSPGCARARSEERRVGEESRSRRRATNRKKKE